MLSVVFRVVFIFIFIYTVCFKYFYSITVVSSDNSAVAYYSPQTLTIEEVCTKVLELTSSEKETKIIVNERNGGLGHKTISTVEGIIYALLTRKQLWFVTPPTIYNLTDSCLKRREYRGDISQLRVCGGTECFIMNGTSLDLYNSFNVDSVLYDVRASSNLIGTKENLQSLIDYGILVNGQNWDALKRALYRIVLHPEASLLNDINEEKEKLTRKHTFGVHIRTGGNLANDFERTSMISEEALHRIPAQILSICKTENINPQDWNLYISSDSDKAIKYIKTVLGLFFNVVSSDKFKHGHTSSGRLSDATLKGALLDMHILGDSDILLVTKGSGFARISASMAYPNPVYHIPVNRTFVKKIVK